VDNVVDFTGQVVVVTGGTRGIGRCIAQSFIELGAEVLICGRNAVDDPPVADDRTATFVAADVCDPDSVEKLISEVVHRYGALHVLVNNAGGSPNREAATMSPRFIEKVVTLNLLAPFYVAQRANAVMQQQTTGGVIVNIGSVSAHNPAPLSAAYSAAKAGLLQLTRSLALEWGPKVRVNHITAGLVRTDASASHYGSDGGTAVAATIPMRRMAEPSDVASACVYLASPLAEYVTGADLAVHGGGEVPARFIVATAASAAAAAD
jgi:NAD(P)-dependent dehydrogenase (short-subunit alcohol dehydrogenase family)